MEMKLDHNAFEPLYHQLKRMIVEKIESGDWKPGDRIASENELKNQFGISRNTVQRAIDELVQEGILERKQGRGTFVTRPKIEQSLTSFYSFSRVMADQGLEPKDIILDIEIIPATKKIADRLQINERDDVYALRRLRCANNEPIILETSYLPKKLISTMDKNELSEHSLYGFLQTVHNIIVVKAKESFEPVLSKQDESGLLQIKENAPCLLLDRVAYDSKGRTIEYCRSIVRGDRCRFYTELF